ncbi:MAG TPA: hypothetical protein VM779_15225 [Thermoanaerobaculia bacterium]|nr:hypothetical protein [Thermoanaerobaculia bacterium]
MARTLQISRDEAIARLRRELTELTDIENSVCKVAAERGVFCGGFRQFSDAELREKYDWIVAKNPAMSRADLERIANDWQLAQQDVRDLPIACDVQARVHDTCRGWDDFTNEKLALFFQQLTGQEIVIS